MVLLKRIWPILFILVASIFAILPLFHPGFFPMHDDTQVQRVFEMGKALREGMFPVRWVSDLGYGYGYPIFNFYAPLAYYVGGIFVVLGLNALAATKLMMGIGIVLSGVTMYLLGNALWGKKGGVISGIVYLYATYHAVDMYVRGDVSEFWAYAFIPLAFFGSYKIYKSLTHSESFLRLWIWISVASFGFAGVILSHNLTALMVTPFLLISMLLLVMLSKNKLNAILVFSFFILFAVAISAFYWLPVLGEMKYTNVLSQIGAGADFHNHFVCPIQFWYSPWGYGGSVAGCIDGLSFMLGRVSIGLGVLALVGLLAKKRTRWIGMLLGVGVLVSLFLTTNYALFIWDLVKPMAFFQYPWRFLLMAWFFLSVLIGGLGFIFESIKVKYLSLSLTSVVIILIIFFNAKYFTPSQFIERTSDQYTAQKELRWTVSKISDEYMPQNFQKPQSVSLVPTSLLQVSPAKATIMENTTAKKVIVVEAATDHIIGINLAYFPAWHGFIDGKEVTVLPTKKGIQLPLPAGNHIVTLAFIQTPLETAGDILSLTVLTMLILGIIMRYFVAYEKKNS